MNPRSLLLVSVLAASPALASTARLHLIELDDVGPSTMPLLAPDAAALPYTFHLPALELDGVAALPVALPDGALMEGGGASARSDVLPVLAILLSALVGFGTGHLVAGDRDGFVLFLVVDLVIWAVASVLTLTPLYFFGPWGIGGVLVLISHIFQVLDVYPKVSGGRRLVQRAREESIVLTAASGPDPALPGTTRVFGFAF